MSQTPSKFPLSDVATHTAQIKGKIDRRKANQRLIEKYVKRFGPALPRGGTHPDCGHAAIYRRSLGGERGDDLEHFGNIVVIVRVELF